MTSSPNYDYFSNKVARSCGRWTSGLANCATILFACIASSLAMPAAAASVDKMLTATPLVLKDGRIAEVSVHTIPFPDDAVALSSQTQNVLNALTQSIATDCFLTAQVIGHVDKSEISDRETADIHRLARARADTIQSSLINNGLPAASIASVWDWRFMVQQARVTLWMFRLTAGEDCENTPLEHQNSDQIVAATSDLETVQANATSKAAERITAAEPNTASASVTQQVVPAAKPKSKELTTPLPVRAVQAHESIKVAPMRRTNKSNETRIASLAPAQPDDKKGSANLVENGALEIVFANNSSFFPEGTGNQLRAFLRNLEREKSYTLQIQTSLDTDADVAGATSQDEAQRYNSWMAERRYKRVEAWLIKNSEGRNLKIEPSLIENDGSRRVRIEPKPLG